MNTYLKQSTASQTRAVGPFVDDTDFKTAETGLTIANTDVKLMKNGGASANKNSGGGTHLVNGVYALTFDATDSATVGELTGSIVVAGAAPVYFKFWVLEEAIYDALFGASAAGFNSSGQVAVASLAANTITATSIASDAITAAKIASDALTAAKFASDCLTAAKFASDVTTELQSGLATASALSNLAGKFAGITLLAEWLGQIAGKQAANSTAQTEIRATGAGSGTYNSTTDSLEALKDDQMTAADLENAVWDATIADHLDAGSTGEALDSATTGGAPTVQEIVDGVWDEPIADHLDSGSTGASLNGAGAAGDPWTTTLPGAYGAGTAGNIVGNNLNATVSSRATPAQVASELAAYDGPTNAEMVARTLAATSYATAAAQTTAQADLDTITGADGVVIASGSQTFNMTGNINGNLSGSVGSVTGAVGSVAGAVGSVTGAVGSVTGAVGSVTGNVGGNVTGSVGSLATAAANTVQTRAEAALAAYGAIP